MTLESDMDKAAAAAILMEEILDMEDLVYGRGSTRPYCQDRLGERVGPKSGIHDMSTTLDPDSITLPDADASLRLRREAAVPARLARTSSLPGTVVTMNGVLRVMRGEPGRHMTTTSHRVTCAAVIVGTEARVLGFDTAPATVN